MVEDKELVVIKNPDNGKVFKILKQIYDNDGYCLNNNLRNKDTKCMCKKFREQKEPGDCPCGLYTKVYRRIGR